MGVKLYFEDCKKCKRAGSTTPEGKCYHCGADYSEELGMKKVNVLTPEQIATQARRLFLEEQTFTFQKYLWDLKRECTEHVVMQGRILFSPAKGKVVTTNPGEFCTCAVCGEDLGWMCPVNPKGYCEYEDRNEDCKFCGIPSERK